MDRQLTMVVIAALLHDIGKFAQRAGRPYSKEMKEEYLTSYQGRQGHWHTVYTDYFIEKDLPLPESMENDRSRIARLASAHHRPEEKNQAEMILMIADRLSSGTDRITVDHSEEVAGFRESRLGSVFDEVELAKHRFDPPSKWFHDLVALEPGSEKIFPRRGVAKGDAGDYAALFERFYGELRTLEGMKNHQLYIEALTALLEKYSWCIPSSSYKTLPDVSLFDHAFSTAGIAQALFLYHRDNGKSPSFADTEAKFLLTGGDLSGIQKYIFGITRNSGRGVSKIFRARFFFLQVLTRAIVIEIQRNLGLYSMCRILDSGGKFILLLPNNEKVREYLLSFDNALQFWFRKKFKGKVTMNLSWSTLMGQEDFKIKKFQTKLDEANAAIEAAKYCKLSKTFSHLGMVIDQEYEQIEAGNCALCGVNAADSESSRRYSQKEGADLPICRDCCDQIVYFGTKLPKTNYLIYGTTGKVPIYGNIFLTLSEEAPQTESDRILQVDALIDTPRFGRYRLARHLPVLTKEDLADERWFKLFEQEIDFEASGGHETPMTFNMIAKKSKKESGEKLIGRELLGFLKADVDNLGFLFSLGLGDRLSVARFSMLSRMLNIFFSEYLVELVKREFPSIYVVFAGGDDLFLVGPWWQTVKFAVELRNRFSQFCAANPDITLSCAVLPARPRLPMRKAAELVEYQLEIAKRIDEPNRLKDSVCFLGETMSWPELDASIELGLKFDQSVMEKQRTNFSTAFLHRLMVYHKMYRDFTEGKKIMAGNYLALAHYDIGRNISSEKTDNKEELEFLYRIFTVGVKERPELARLNIPLFFAINMNRED